MRTDTQSTAAVRNRRNGRWLSPLRIQYPQWPADRASRPAYDLPMARQLLALTADLPASKRGLLAVLTEYRHALHALALTAEPGRAKLERATAGAVHEVNSRTEG